jgi:hypothetical protein
MKWTRRDSVHMSEYETCLTYSWENCTYHWHMITAQVYGRVPGTFRYYCLSIIPNHIRQLTESTQCWGFESECETKPCSLIAKPQGVQVYHSLSDTSDLHPWELAIEIQLGFPWLSCSFGYLVFPGLWLKFRHKWDLKCSPGWDLWIGLIPRLMSVDLIRMCHSSPGTAL